MAERGSLSARDLYAQGRLVEAAHKEADACDRDSYDITAAILRDLADAVEQKGAHDELIRSSQMFIVVVKSGDYWHELRETETAVAQYAQEALAEGQKRWPEDEYRVAVKTVEYRWPKADDA